MMGQIAGAIAPENQRLQNQSGEDVALLRPFLGTVGVGLYSGLLLRFYDSFNPPYVSGWEGKVPYFSRWEVALPWLCLTAGLAAYLAGALTVRLFGKAIVGTSVAAIAVLALSFPLMEAVQMRDRDYSEQYNTCRQITESQYRCEGTTVGVSDEASETELQRLLRTGPPAYPYPRGFLAAVGLGLAIFSAAPRLGRGKLWFLKRARRPSTDQAPG